MKDEFFISLRQNRMPIVTIKSNDIAKAISQFTETVFKKYGIDNRGRRRGRGGRRR